jgi:orotate phosphoribosyltransferase-like protein
MKNPRLEALRRASRLRTGGMSYAKIAEALGVSTPTAHAMVDKAHDLRRQGKLFTDIDSVLAEDTYLRMSLRRKHGANAA